MGCEPLLGRQLITYYNKISLSCFESKMSFILINYKHSKCMNLFYDIVINLLGKR